MVRLGYILTAIAALAIWPLALALTIPEDFPDGVYEINWLGGEGGGVGIVSYFEVPHDVNITARKFNCKLPLPAKLRDVSCLKTDNRLENITLATNWTRPDDQQQAMHMLANWCEMAAYVHKDAMVFALVNDMLWYVCNWDNLFQVYDSQQRCSKVEIHAANGMMDKACGADKRGELSIAYWQKTYGRSHRFGDICQSKDTWSAYMTEEPGGHG